MRRALSVLTLVILPTSLSAQSPSTVQVHGFLSGRAISVQAQNSWLEGGAGRFDIGAANADDRDTKSAALVHAGVDWTPRSWLALHADAVARREPSGSEGNRAGLVQAYVDASTERWRVRAGLFWLPTSRENVDPLWHSRYSLTWSALNSWIGQEVRPLGVDVQYSPNFYVTLGGTVFGGNDTMGTEIASRGWTFGSRMTLFDERLPLPAPEEHYSAPVERDLDGRPGHSERIRLQLPERALIQFTHIDNRAKLVPDIDGQEPWLTRFDIVGAQVGMTSPTTIAAEWASGWTSLNFGRGTFTMDFDTAYLLLSRKRDRNRWTVRFDRFSTRDQRRPNTDSAHESGHAVTVAWLHDLRTSVRLGLEYTKVNGDRPSLAEDGYDPETGGSTLTLELRYGF